VADGIRTRDHRDHNPGLYQLSYRHRGGTKDSPRVAELFAIVARGSCQAECVPIALRRCQTPFASLLNTKSDADDVVDEGAVDDSGLRGHVAEVREKSFDVQEARRPIEAR
jgi:hypothetical protein